MAQANGMRCFFTLSSGSGGLNVRVRREFRCRLSRFGEDLAGGTSTYPGRTQYSKPLPPMNSRRMEVGGTWSG